MPLGKGVELQTGKVVDTEQGDFHVCLICGDILIVDAGRWRPATLYEILHCAAPARAALAIIHKAVRRGAFLPRAGAGAGGMRN